MFENAKWIAQEDYRSQHPIDNIRTMGYNEKGIFYTL